MNTERTVIERPGFSLEWLAEKEVMRLKTAQGCLELAPRGAVSPPGQMDGGGPWQLRTQRRVGNHMHWHFAAASTFWEERELQVDIGEDELLFRLEVQGRGKVDTVSYFADFPASIDPEPHATFRYLSWARRDCVNTWKGSPTFPLRVFNPQPNLYEEQELPGTCQQRLTCATTFGSETFDTFFAPPPYVYVFDDTFSMGVLAAEGEHRYHHYDYCVGNGWGLQLHFDGMTSVDGRWQSPVLRLGFGNDREDAMANYLNALKRIAQAPSPSEAAPIWARRPMVCGWGQQTVWARQESHTNLLPEGSPITKGAGNYATQAAYEKIVSLVDQHELPYGNLTIDMGWSTCQSLPLVDSAKWPDLRGFIAREHARGKKVLLWLATWNPIGLLPEFLMPHDKDLKDCVDPTHPGFRRSLAEAIEFCVSPEGLDADGFKLDFTGDMPRGAGYRPHGDLWGLELLRDYVELIHRSMKQTKADTVLETHCAHPLFVPFTEILRLNDIFCLREDVRPMMAFRARIARLVNPDWIIDTDNDPFISRDAWRDYMQAQPELGVPSLYSVTHVSFALPGEEPEVIEPEDLALVRKIWQDYNQRLESGLSPDCSKP